MDQRQLVVFGVCVAAPVRTWPPVVEARLESIRGGRQQIFAASLLGGDDDGLSRIDELGRASFALLVGW